QGNGGARGGLSRSRRWGGDAGFVSRASAARQPVGNLVRAMRRRNANARRARGEEWRSDERDRGRAGTAGRGGGRSLVPESGAQGAPALYRSRKRPARRREQRAADEHLLRRRGPRNLARDRRDRLAGQGSASLAGRGSGLTRRPREGGGRCRFT